MKLLKNKKSQEGAGAASYGKVIGWVIVIALIVLLLFWYSGLGSKGLEYIRSFY